MYGLKVVNGDLLVKGDGNVTEITGADRIKQELAHWLIEPLGTDTLYGKFGSTLWNSVGDVNDSESLSRIKAEVTRVVSNYVAYQKRQINDDLAVSEARFLTNWGLNDIIDTVDSIDVNAVADTVNVTVKLTTSGGTVITVEQSS